jgi:hypothetical protein
LTGEAEGLELDVAVPAMDRGAALTTRGGGSGLIRIPAARERAAAFVRLLEARVSLP